MCPSAACTARRVLHAALAVHCPAVPLLGYCTTLPAAAAPAGNRASHEQWRYHGAGTGTGAVASTPDSAKAEPLPAAKGSSPSIVFMDTCWQLHRSGLQLHGSDVCGGRTGGDPRGHFCHCCGCHRAASRLSTLVEEGQLPVRRQLQVRPSASRNPRALAAAFVSSADLQCRPRWHL